MTSTLTLAFILSRAAFWVWMERPWNIMFAICGRICSTAWAAMTVAGPCTAVTSPTAKPVWVSTTKASLGAVENTVARS